MYICEKLDIMATIRNITKAEDYRSFIENNEVAIVKFGAQWCGPCRVLETTLANLDVTKLKGAALAEVNVDEEEMDDITAELNIRGIPVLIYYKNGTEYARSVGAVGESEILEKLQ